MVKRAGRNKKRVKKAGEQKVSYDHIKYSKTALERDFEADIDPKGDDVKYHLVREIEELDRIFQRLSFTGNGYIAVDTETEGLNHLESDIVGICLCVDPYNAYYIPTRHLTGENAEEGMTERFVQHLKEYDGQVLFFNSKFDLRFLKNEGLEFNGINHRDTASLIYNLDLTIGRPLTLDYVKETVFGWEAIDINHEDIPIMEPEDVGDYGAQDAHATYLIKYYFNKPADRVGFPIDVDKKMVEPVIQMENLAKPIDIEYCKKTKEKIQKKLDLLHTEICNDLNVEDINLNSPKQIREAFKANNIETGEKTDTGKMSTGADAIKRLSDEYPVCDKIIQHRSYGKDLSNILDKFIKYYEEKGTNEMRFAYNLTRVPTGRLAGGSKSDDNDFFVPINCQAIKKSDKAKYVLEDGEELLGYDIVKFDEEKHDEKDFKGQKLEGNVRHPIKPQPGCYWLSVDFSGQELRILANLIDNGSIEQESKMVEEFKKEDGDLHVRTRDEVLSHYGDFDRGDAKTLNYSVCYGIGVPGLAKRMNISTDEAEEILDNFWDNYTALDLWKDGQQEDCREQGYVVSWFNRYRYLEKYYQGSWGQQGYADRLALNHPIQSSAADIMKMAFCRVYNNVLSEYPDDLFLEMQIHDEQNFSITKDPELIQEIVPKIKKQMEVTPPQWSIPMEVDLEIGTSFGRLVPMSRGEDGIYRLVGEYPIHSESSPIDDSQEKSERKQRAEKIDREEIGEDLNVSACTRCDELTDHRTQIVSGTGDTDAEIMFIGEAPGKNEDKQGEPFVGRSGDILDDALLEAGISRQKTYITNLIKCRPPNNRDPDINEISNCSGYLGEEILAVDPTVICPLGRQAMMNLLLNGDERMSDVVGKEFTFRHFDFEFPVIPNYHPAAVLYDRSKEDIFFDIIADLEQFKTEKTVNDFFEKSLRSMG